MVRTRSVRKKKSFSVKSLDTEKWAIPMYVLYGIANTKEFTKVDTYKLAEFFYRKETPGVWERISNALYKFADYVDPNNGESFLAVLTKGSQSFDNPEILEDFYQDKLLLKYDLDEYGISKYLFHGKKGMNWYPETLKVFKKMLPGYDIELFVKLFAITSPRNNFQANLRHALKAYDLFTQRLPFEGKFLGNVVSMLNDFRDKKFIFEKEQRNGRRKVANFARAILGDKNAVVLDSWLMRATGLAEEYKWEGTKAPHKPRVTEYDLMENYVRQLAECCNYEPRQIVAMLWHGTRTVNSPHKITDTKKILTKVLY